MIQLSDLTKTFGDRVLFDHVTWQITRSRARRPVRAERRRQDHAAQDDGRPRRARLGRDPQAVRADRRLPAAGRPHPRRAGPVFEEAASAFGELLAMKAEMHALEERLGDASIPEAEHDAMLHRYSDLQDRFRIARRLQHRAEDGDRAAGPRLQDDRLRAADRDVLRRLADAHRAGEAAARRAEPAAARRADQPPRSRGAQLARGVPQRLPARGDPRLARPLLPRRRRHAHRRSRRCGRSPTTTATTAATWSSTTRASRRCARPSASRTRKSRASRCSSTASATRRPRRRRCRAASRCSRRWCRSRCRPSARRSTSRFRPARRAAGRSSS